LAAQRQQASRGLIQQGERAILSASFSTFIPVEKWAWPTSFLLRMAIADLQNDIQQQLRDLDSQLDLVALERPGSEALRLFIDHPEGVDLALCERVSNHLSHLRDEFSLEVSSPGTKRRRQEHVSETAKEQP